jgi:D-3-phosphoglycerate dehydrogenase
MGDSQRFRLLVTDGLHPSGLSVLQRCERLDLDVRAAVSAEELRSLAGQYDGLVIHVATKVTAAVLEQALPRLKLVACASVGFDHVDVVAAGRHGVKVMSAAGANADSVGDLAMALMLAMARRLPECRDNLAAGRWDRKALSGFALKEKTLGILGLGHTGRATALRAAAFGMKVVGYDPLYPPGTAIPGVSHMMPNKAEVLREADVLTAHVPLGPETHGLIAQRDLAAMKPGSFVINTSRGGVVREADIQEFLDRGIIAGYGVDVFETEPLPPESWLRHHPRVVAAPHLGGATESARTAVATHIARQTIEFFRV